MKGHTNNPNGRPKGTPNKVTSSIRNWIVELINGNREQLQKDLLQLEPKDRLIMIERLLPYIMPKVANASDVEGACYNKDDFQSTNPMDWDIEQMSLKSWFEK